MNADLHGALRVGIGGSVGSGKTALVEARCKRFGNEYEVFVMTNDIHTKELCLQRELGLRGMYKKRIDVPAELRAFIERQQRALLELDGISAFVMRAASRKSIVPSKRSSRASYGFSNLSGTAIVRERLEAIPEAVCTLAEQGRYEAAGRRIQISE